MHLKDISFWYKDKHATVAPGELTGLVEMNLPAQGINVDLKVRMIPSKTKGKLSREEQGRFHVVERCAVEISDEVEISVKDSNHPVLVNIFSRLVKSRIKEALERTLTGQLGALVDWLDSVAYDVGERRKVFEDLGIGGGAAFIAAFWSEVGRFERKAEEGGISMGMKATGTGIIFEEKTEVPVPTTGGTGSQTLEEKFETKERVLAVGAEPQVLSGEKRGPLGTGSESLSATVQGMLQEQAMDVDVEGAASQAREMKEMAKDRVEGFRTAILRRKKEEKKTVGQTWKSDAFDMC